MYKCDREVANNVFLLQCYLLTSIKFFLAGALLRGCHSTRSRVSEREDITMPVRANRCAQTTAYASATRTRGVHLHTRISRIDIILHSESTNLQLRIFIG